MYPFSQSLSPALHSHQQAQLAFFTDLSRSFLHTVQQYCELNLHLARTLFEETTRTGERLMQTPHPNDIAATVVAGAKPAADRLREYQHHVARIAANTQVDIASVTEEHLSEISRTARELADQVARATEEQTGQAQQAADRSSSEPFQRPGASADGRQVDRSNEMRGGSTLQSASDTPAANHDKPHGGSAQGGSQGNVQGQQGKPGSSARKEN